MKGGSPMAAVLSTPRPRTIGTLILPAVAFFMVVLDALVVVTALPAIQRDLGATMSLLEWTVNAFTLAVAAGIITAAALGDRLGRRRIFTLGLGLFTLASAACALAPTAGVLIAARAVQGLGEAMVMPIALTMLVSAFPPERRGAVVGLYGGIGGPPTAPTPPPGGAGAHWVRLRSLFLGHAPVGGVRCA